MPTLSVDPRRAEQLVGLVDQVRGFEHVKELAVTALQHVDSDNVTKSLMGLLADPHIAQKLKDQVAIVIADRKDPAELTVLVDKLKVHGKLTNQGATTHNGQRVVAIYNAREHATLYVAATGTPYPVSFVKAKQPNAGTLMFDDWNKSVSVTAPKGALDLSQFGG